MKRSVSVALFDLGGTLFYDDPASWTTVYPRADRALWDSLKSSGVRATAALLYGSEDSLLQYYYQLRATGLDEPGAGGVLRDLLIKRSIAFSEVSLKKALAAMYAVTQSNWHLEDDAFPALEGLQAGGIRLGVVSNGSDDANARCMLEKAHLDPFFELVLTSAAFGRRKPDPSIFRAALAQFGVAPEQAVMVGDNYDADIVGAQGIGMRTIWITRRVPPVPVAPAIQPEAKVGTLTEIPALIV